MLLSDKFEPAFYAALDAEEAGNLLAQELPFTLVQDMYNSDTLF